jgi:hypothetical protein
MLGGHSIGHSEQKCVYVRVLFRTVSAIELFRVIARVKECQDALRRAITPCPHASYKVN